MKCLDATFLIDFLRNDRSAINKALEIKEEVLVTTSINIFEVLLGIYRKKKDRKSTRLNSSHSAKSRMPSSA